MRGRHRAFNKLSGVWSVLGNRQKIPAVATLNRGNFSDVLGDQSGFFTVTDARKNADMIAPW